MIDGEGLRPARPVPGDRERWLELLHDPDELRFGMPVFVPVPDTFEQLDARVTEAAGSSPPGSRGHS